MKPSEILRKIKNNPDTRYGICSNFLFYCRYPLTYCMKIHGISYKYWEHFSGQYPYPIPAQSPEIAYRTLNKWTKESNYGRLRWQLLDWLIEQFELKGA